MHTYNNAFKVHHVVHFIYREHYNYALNSIYMNYYVTFERFIQASVQIMDIRRLYEY